jgi:hypothetical protein
MSVDTSSPDRKKRKKSRRDDDFSDAVKRKLADRAGHHCFRCLRPTTCAGEDDMQGKAYHFADAAHQAAAGSKDPRHDPSQTNAERSSLENGIWLCKQCHDIVDKNPSTFPVEDLKRLRLEAEERARKLVLGEIVFELKGREQDEIKKYLSVRPLENLLARSRPGGTLARAGGRLGIQIVPYRAILEEPHIRTKDLITHGLPTNGNVQATPDSKGIYYQADDGSLAIRLDRDLTAVLWKNYEPLNQNSNTMPGLTVAEDVIRFIRGCRYIFTKHGISDPRVIVRTRFDNVLGKLLFTGVETTLARHFKEPTVDAEFSTADEGEAEELEYLTQLWHCAGAKALPAVVIQRVRDFIESVRWSK